MATLNTPVAGMAVSCSREQVCRTALRWIAALAALGLAGHLIVLLWAQHEFTTVEPLVVLQANMFAHGKGLYWGINRYPYTISAYGPILYTASGYLHKWGVPAYQSVRVISFTALAMALWLCWQSLSYITRNTYARASAVIVAASTANILYWGTAGQTDILACCFSLAAFTAFLKFREQGDGKALALSAVLVILAVFTKQTFMAAGAAIAITLLREDRKRAALWIAGVGLIGGGIALGLNALTQGGYFADAILANINPLAWYKLRDHVNYFVLTGAGVIVTATVGAWNVSRRTAPLYCYAGLAIGVWLLTAPKIGSAANYQIESMLVLSLCCGCALDQLDFFPSLFSARRTWVTLLQIPLLLHITVNLMITGHLLAGRVLVEPYAERETAALKRFVDRPGRVLSVQYDSLVRYRGYIEVEPLIYLMLVNAGLTDPAPLLHDLETRQFATVILGENVFVPRKAALDPEFGTLTDAQLAAIRNNYKLTGPVDGPNSVYVYEPRNN